MNDDNDIQERDVRRTTGGYKQFRCRHCNRLITRVMFSMSRSPQNDINFAKLVEAARVKVRKHIDVKHPAPTAAP